MLKPWFPAASRTTAVLALYAFRCAYCGHPATEVDHIVPRATGGSDVPLNLTAACRSCNAIKGDRRLKPEIEKELLAEAFILADEVKELTLIMKKAEIQACSRRMSHLMRPL